MLDGKKAVTLNPGICTKQNTDYNGWTCYVNRNLVLFWDPYGTIIDASVDNDSKSSLQCDMYTQILKLPDGFKIVCDITFATKGDLEGKILKLQDESKSYEDKKDYERQLPHLRQCSEWGNQILVSAF